MPTALPAHKVTIEKVELKTLKVSLAPGVRTQREVTPERIKKLKPFDTAVAGVIVVNRRKPSDGGGDYVVDGWGRCNAGMEEGITHLRAEIHHGLSIPNEGALFRIKNDSKAVTVLEKYLVGLTEGEQVACDTKAILDKHNLEMGGAGPDNVGSVAAILKVTREHGTDALDYALAVAEATWGREAMTWDGSIIGGLGRFYAAHAPQLAKQSDIVTKFQAAWAAPQLCKSQIQFVATSGGAHYDGSGGRAAASYRVFVNQYNKGRTKARRLVPVA